jgi:hypothetical protein
VTLVEIGFSVDYFGRGAHPRILSRTCFWLPSQEGKWARFWIHFGYTFYRISLASGLTWAYLG